MHLLDDSSCLAQDILMDLVRKSTVPSPCMNPTQLRLTRRREQRAIENHEILMFIEILEILSRNYEILIHHEFPPNKSFAVSVCFNLSLVEGNTIVSFTWRQ